MISNTTAMIVALFFFHGAIASFIVGLQFVAKKDHALKLFGLGAIFGALAFSIWAVLAATRLSALPIMATAAAVFLILSLYCFFLAGVQHLDTESYNAALFAGALAALALFILRTFIFPARLTVTSNGFLFFNLPTAVKAAYIMAIAISILPAANIVAGKFKKTIIEPLIKVCFTTLAIGGIVLVMSNDTGLLLFAGIGMTVAFALLWATVLADDKKILKKVA